MLVPPQRRSRRENPIVYLDVKIGEKLAGRLLIELRADVVPRTAENFRRLCTVSEEDCALGRFQRCWALVVSSSPFHRVVKDKFCQSGDYLNYDGSGGESTFDQPDDPKDDDEISLQPNQDPTAAFALSPSPRPFVDENFILRHTGPGVLSMANTGPDSNTSLFYLHFGPTPQFDDQHVVFGCLLEEKSFNVLNAIHAVATERGDPKLPVEISSCGQIDTSTMLLH